MNDEKPSRPDSTPIEQSPGRGTLGQPPMGGGDHLYLSSQQLRDDDRPSWKAPAEKRISTGALVAMLIVVLVIVLVLALKLAGVF